MLHAQGYRPLLDPNSAWYESFHLVEPPWDPGYNPTEECYKYFLQGDTSLNDTTYLILKRDGYFWPSVDLYDDAFVAFVREDTMDRKVYMRDAVEEPELLMYDFSVGVGPYPSTIPVPGSGLTVTAIDTMQLINGDHRVIILNDYLSIIEGIGAVTGFFGTQTSGTVGWGGMVCHTLNGVSDFEYSNDQTCPCGFSPSIDRA